MERLIGDRQLCERFAGLSYRAIRVTWNAQTAAERLLSFGERVLAECERTGGRPDMDVLNAKLPAEGPMSRDPGLRPYLKVPGAEQ